MSFMHARRESYRCEAQWETRNSIRRRCLLRYYIECTCQDLFLNLEGILTNLAELALLSVWVYLNSERGFIGPIERIVNFYRRIQRMGKVMFSLCLSVHTRGGRVPHLHSIIILPLILSIGGGGVLQ